MKNEEVYLKAYASVLEPQRELEDYFRFTVGSEAPSGPGLPYSGRGVPGGAVRRRWGV